MDLPGSTSARTDLICHESLKTPLRCASADRVCPKTMVSVKALTSQDALDMHALLPQGSKVREGQGLAYRWAVHGTLRACGKRTESLQSSGYLICSILVTFIIVAGQHLSCIIWLQGNLTEFSVVSGFGEALD